MVKRAWMIAVLAVGLIAGAEAPPTDYVIKLDRPSKVGEQASVAVSLEETTNNELSRQGQVLRSENSTMKAELEADARIVSVDEGGHPTALTYTVRKWEGSIDGKPVTAIKPGMVLSAQAEGDEFSIRSDKAEFSEKEKKLLRQCFPSVRKKDQPTDDEVFGTSDRKRVGDKWPVNAAAVAKRLTTTRARTVDEKGITGSVELRKVHRINGVPCLHLEMAFKVSNILGGMEALAGSFEAHATTDCPVDVSLPSVGGSMTIKRNMEWEVVTPDGPARIKMSTAGKKTRTMIPIK